MQTQPTPDALSTSTNPMLHCCDTWHFLAGKGQVLPNLPKEPATWAAIASMDHELLRPLREKFGAVVLTYGFAGPELVKAILARATIEKPANISPRGDQHAGHELNSWGNRICKRDGIAVDLKVPRQNSLQVAKWVQDENLPFDRIYLYDDERPFHMSWHPQPIGQVIQMWVTKTGRLMPRVVVRGRSSAHGTG